MGCFQVLPAEYPELDWTEKFFAQRLKRVAPTSGIRKERSAVSEFHGTGE